MLVLSFSMGIWSYLAIRQLGEVGQAHNLVQGFNEQLYQINYFEQNFLTYELFNEEFFQQSYSPYEDSLQQAYQRIGVLTQQLKQLPFGTQDSVATLLDSIELAQTRYANAFHRLKTTVLARGFKDYGQVGTLRTAIHRVEQSAVAYDRATMLMLRRHEKDFMLRKDPAYQQKFNALLAQFAAQISQQSGSEAHHQLLRELTTYQEGFNHLVQLEQQIGFDHQSGLLGQLRQRALVVADQVQLLNARLRRLADHYQRAQQRRIVWWLATQMLLGFGLMALISHRATRLNQSFDGLHHKLGQLAKGQLPLPFARTGQDEIGQTQHALNTLLEGIGAYTKFAHCIGEGRLQTPFAPLSADDTLGNALLTMRDNLARASAEETSRRWIDEGLRQVEILLRSFSLSDDDFAQLIATLVNYSGAILGGIFLEEANAPTPTLTLRASYAWGRRKFERSQFAPGKGLVGQAWSEGTTYHLTEIPEDFVRIQSGFGDTLPRALLLVPLRSAQRVIGVLEIATLQPFSAAALEWLELASQGIAATLLRAQLNNQAAQMAEAAQQQAAALLTQEEELRQNNEELQAIQEELQRKEAGYIEEIAALRMQLAAIA